MEKNNIPKNDIRDFKLADKGAQKIAWVKEHMPLLKDFEEEFLKTRPFQNIRISLSVHLEAKTAYLCKVLAAAGAEMAVTGSNVLSTQDDVAAALATEGMKVFAYRKASPEEYDRHIELTLSHKPHIIIDDGGDLVGMIHGKRPDLGEETWGGCEETTTGIIRLRAMESAGLLKFPMVAVNDAKCKHLFDNRYGTGQSVWSSIMNNTNLIVAGKTAVVAGYGWCSKGIAMRGAALGADIIVTEIDPVKAMEAKMDGHKVMTMKEAAKQGDIFITATGCKDTINMEHILSMKDGAILTNAGHFNVEIAMADLVKKSSGKREVRNNIDEYLLEDGKRVYVIADGRLVNIAAADGHPAEIMDLSFAVQILSALYIKENHERLGKRVVDVSAEIDNIVSNRILKAWGVKIDSLTPEQEKYLHSWEV